MAVVSNRKRPQALEHSSIFEREALLPYWLTKLFSLVSPSLTIRLKLMTSTKKQVKITLAFDKMAREVLFKPKKLLRDPLSSKRVCKKNFHLLQSASKEILQGRKRSTASTTINLYHKTTFYWMLQEISKKKTIFHILFKVLIRRSRRKIKKLSIQWADRSKKSTAL